MTDLEIANSKKIEPINKIAKKLNIEDECIPYGKNKAKITSSFKEKKRKGKLILVTSINPTPYGEGKTTVSIGLNDGLRRLGKNSVAVLREPSLGPVFGIKGGATGGGYAQVVPMEDINLHFTGDFHAITTANNLISSAIDNHIYFGNALNINPDKIFFRRCLDLNDRALRNVTLSSRTERFQITAASEMMSILCLSRDLDDLKRRTDNIIIGFNNDDKPVYAKELKVSGAVATILKDAIYPNLVQSLENNPVIIHGGPFANVGHGCNSIIATNIGLKLADYVVTEAGFGSDLGAEKFFDIKCRKNNLKPDCVVIVATIRALKHHDTTGNNDLTIGIENLQAHIDNMLNYTNHIIVTLNKFESDSQEEINYVKEYVEKQNLVFTLNNVWKEGGAGAEDLANQVISMVKEKNDFHLLYEDNIKIKEKIEKVAEKIYHTTKVNYTDTALEKIKIYEQMEQKHYPVCIAKTQYSITDDAKLLGYPKEHEITISDVSLLGGAQFIVVYLGKIMTMPGLAKNSNYENINIDNDGNITGLF